MIIFSERRVISVNVYSTSIPLNIRFLTEMNVFKFGETEALRRRFNQHKIDVKHRDFYFLFNILNVQMPRTPVDTQNHSLRLLDTSLLLCLKPERAGILPRLVMIQRSPVSAELTIIELLDRLVDYELARTTPLRATTRTPFWVSET